MRVYKKASVLVIALILIVSILSFLFLNKDKFIQQQRVTTFYGEKYLSDKVKLLSFYPKFKDKVCDDFKKENINQNDLSDNKLSFIKFQFKCQMNSLFRDKKPTKDKYISFTRIEDYLDLSNVPNSEIFYIRSFLDLPPTSEDNPVIAIAQNAIDENLPHHFYGIVITDYLFDIRGKKMYGVLYSSFDNAREERNLTFKKEVLEKLEEKYSYWRYLNNSTHMLGAIDE